MFGFILQTPQHKATKNNDIQSNEKIGPWRSPRLKNKNSGGKPIVKPGQDLVVWKCGILQEEESIDAISRSLQATFE
jgi:hypothetical protein